MKTKLVVVLGTLFFILWKGKDMLKPTRSYEAIFKQWNIQVEMIADAYGVSKDFILAIIAQESNGNPSSTGKTPDIGLMQITQPALIDYNRATGNIYHLPDLYNPMLNIQVGTWYISYLLQQFNYNYILVARAYNAGIGNVRKNPLSGKIYSDEVMKHLNFFKELKNESF